MPDKNLLSDEEFEKMAEGEVSVKGKIDNAPPAGDELAEMTRAAANEPVKTPDVSEVELPELPKEPGKTADGMVAVPADEWKKVLETLAILKESANQGKLQQAENKRRPKELPRAYLKVYNGHIVTSWKSAQSELMYAPNNPTTAIGERLKAEYFFKDGGSTGVIDQVYFTREEDRAWVRIKRKEQDSTKLLVEFESSKSEFGKDIAAESGEQLEIDMAFINP